MRCGDVKQLRAELVQLIEEQIETIVRETCGSVTNLELREYDDREKRIEQLYDTLHNLHSAA